MMDKKKIKPVLLAAFLILVISGAAFGATQIFANAENNKTTTLESAQQTDAIDSERFLNSVKGYERPDYSLTTGTLTQDGLVEANVDVSAEVLNAAADKGVKALWALYGLDLNGKTIEMAYNPATPDSGAGLLGTYSASEATGGSPSYHFYADAVTGELLRVHQYREFNREDIAWAFDPKTGADAFLRYPYFDLASMGKYYAEKYDLVALPGKTIMQVQEVHIPTEQMAVNGAYSDLPCDALVEGSDGYCVNIQYSYYDGAFIGVDFGDATLKAHTGGIEVYYPDGTMWASYFD